MRIRHRVPSIFNLSMVDVLCCALGCVILLWLLNMRDARQRAEDAGRTGRDLAAAVKDRDDLRLRVTEAGAQMADLGGQYRTLQGQLADTGRQLEDARRQLATTADRLTKTQGERDTARTRAADLEKQLAAAGERVAALTADLRERGRQVEGLAGKLEDAEARMSKLQALAQQLPGLRADVKTYRDKLTAEAALSKGLEKEMDERRRELARLTQEVKELRAARQTLEEGLAAHGKELGEARSVIEALQTDRKALRTEADRLRASVDNRFAGVTLTGRRVLFLVDMSGSMELVDENTPAPAKWQAVRETLAKVLRSMPDVEQFQVIVFANGPTHLLGNDGRWLPYDPKTSADRVSKALGAIKPEGGTNMYAAMDAAFRYRALGLDTIYLLSDGLPNLGEPLRPEQLRTMSETEKGEVLGKYIRRALKASWNRPVEGQPRVRINAIGFFYESPDVGAFLWALARENDGSFVGMSTP
jgi:predicted  nucleic acid-binding Zn-ribbon protein